MKGNEMITDEEKMIVYIKHQPYTTWFDVNEYVWMYEEHKPKMSFVEYVDMCMADDEEEYGEIESVGVYIKND